MGCIYSGRSRYIFSLRIIRISSFNDTKDFYIIISGQVYVCICVCDVYLGNSSTRSIWLRCRVYSKFKEFADWWTSVCDTEKRRIESPKKNCVTIIYRAIGEKKIMVFYILYNFCTLCQNIKQSILYNIEKNQNQNITAQNAFWLWRFFFLLIV